MDTAVVTRPPDARIEEFGRGLDQIRADVLAGRGPADEAYIRRVVQVQRHLELAARATLFAALFPPAWIAGTALLTTAKILENMELGHNIMHGQWDWLDDPRIHSRSWEWDHAMPAKQWKHSHNFVHHTYTNVIGKDRDVGYGLLRISPDQPWTPWCLAQPLYNAVLALNFEWGIAVYDAEIEAAALGRKPWREVAAQLGAVARKVRRQVLKDYVIFPLLAGPALLPVLAANLTANTARNIWAHTVIICGHFPDGVAFYTEAQANQETTAQEYVRQLTGSANIVGPALLHVMTGNLSHQIEHHLFPDLPSNHYAQIAPRVRALCAEHDLPYNAHTLYHQAAAAWRRILRMALPGPHPTSSTHDHG
jgi:NADPH-dependent stearoyl-CoA 9-desaturase